MARASFSTLQRVEIAEIRARVRDATVVIPVSVLFNESKLLKCPTASITSPSSASGFSTLQRVEIAEIPLGGTTISVPSTVSVLFNESKLLKSCFIDPSLVDRPSRFSTLQRVEIAEIRQLAWRVASVGE